MPVTVSNYGEFGEYRTYLRLVSADNAAEQSRLLKNLARAMREELTERQAQVLTMHYVSNMSMTEIARELGVRTSTISRTAERGRARLSKCLRYGARSLLEEYTD